MSNNPLHVIAVDEKPNSSLPSQQGRKQEAEAIFEKKWHHDPNQFNPHRNSQERERITRTWALLIQFFSPANTIVADLGCGWGIFSHQLRDAGAEVHAVDISSLALNKLKEKNTDNIKTFQQYIPRTTLKDDFYDLVMSTDVIAYLHKDEYRLFFAELSRLIKPDGYMICSTPLDINTEDPLERLIAMAETEFIIEQWQLSHHKWTIRLHDFFKAPARFVRGWKKKSYRDQQLSMRHSISYWWFRINSTLPLACLWWGISLLTAPVANFINQKRSLLLFLEKACRFIESESGISHAIFIGKRKPIQPPLPEEELPKERKHKKQLWE